MRISYPKQKIIFILITAQNYKLFENIIIPNQQAALFH
jgi:hypothetical protein